jgi:wyosine [tRNA(Phe)-imidazoG37] synthetase (radical SAM superfamily)
MTLKRDEYAPPAEIVRELARWKKESGRRPEYVTLGGRGEPCLNSGLAGIIAGARDVFPGVPVAVLTNSTMLNDPKVRRELARADTVLPSMDTLVEEQFPAVNRPHPRLHLDSIAESLKEFREEFSGKLFLEVLLVSGLNDDAGNREKLEEYVRELAPDRVDVATMTRPGSEREASPVPEQELERWRNALHAEHTLRKSSPMRTKDIFQTDDPERIREMVISSITRRPQTAKELARALAVAEDDVERTLADLAEKGDVATTRSNGKIFYGNF